MAKKIVIAIRKGGVGKTASARNIAAALALRGHRTLLVDLDEQANATTGMGFVPQELPATLNDLFADAALDPKSVVLNTSVENLHLLPGHPNLAQTETGMTIKRADPTSPDPIGSLKAILDLLENDYDFMVFDTPPSIKYMTINGLAAADELIVPAGASAHSEDGLLAILKEYERARSSYNPNLKLRGILLTRVKRTNASQNVFSGVHESYTNRTLPQAIVESTAVDEAEQLQQPVVVYDPAGTASQGYLRIADIILSGEPSNE